MEDWETVAPLVEEANGLCKLLEALDGRRTSDQKQSGSVREFLKRDISRVKLLLQTLQVASVCTTSGFVAAKPTGSFATFADWASTLNQHSQLDLYISTARKQFAPSSFNYPFPSVLDAVQTLFLQGDPDPPAWKLKVSILGYYLLDSGVLSNLKVLTKPPFAWEESDVNLLEGRYYLDLYECSAGRDAQTFENACMKLKVAGPAGMPFEVIEKLRCFGHPKQALAIWGPYRMTERQLPVLPNR